MIELSGVHYHYGSGAEADVGEVDTAAAVRDVIRGVDLTIMDGEFVAILGANGSGKSTLAKLINGLIEPTQGRVTVNGLDTLLAANKLKVRQSVGFVFQDPSRQIVASVVEDELAFGPENLGLEPGEIRRRLEWAMSALGISHLRESEPTMLSGGQMQRVAIASVLVMQPQYIIMDEPTAMLDPVGRSEVLAAVRYLNSELGLAIILITHHMEEVLQASRVVVIDDGQVVVDACPRALFGQVAKLREYGLDIPAVVDLVWRLRMRGMTIPPEVVDAAQLVDCLGEIGYVNESGVR